MKIVSTFYFSRVLGEKVYSPAGELIGKLIDLVVDRTYVRPKVVAAKLHTVKGPILIDFENCMFEKNKGQYSLFCIEAVEAKINVNNTFSLAKNIMDRQIIDMDGRKLVRVNDVRLAVLKNGTYTVAVDVGFEGLMRRLGIAKPLNILLSPIKKSLPSHLILWDDVETIDFGHEGIKLSKVQSNLEKLHPSDLADIIEDMDSNTQIAFFTMMDEERAADVLEELEPGAQKNVLERLSIGKAADLLEKMPADEVADIFDELRASIVEELLKEMHSSASTAVRKLLEYPYNLVGSIMTTDYISFNEKVTVGQAISELRKLKPEADTIYYLYILNDKEKLVATVALRDLIVSEPDVTLQSIMNKDVISVNDFNKVESLIDTISKYSLLAIPVVNGKGLMMGVVIINDVVYNLMKSKKRRI